MIVIKSLFLCWLVISVSLNQLSMFVNSFYIYTVLHLHFRIIRESTYLVLLILTQTFMCKFTSQEVETCWLFLTLCLTTPTRQTLADLIVLRSVNIVSSVVLTVKLAGRISRPLWRSTLHWELFKYD